MRMILEISSHVGDGAVHHRIVESFPVQVGRGYHNDVILPDPYVSPKHVRIDFDGEAWMVHDLESANGVEVNGKTVRSASVRLASGDILRLGQTEIRVLASTHPVEDTLRIQKVHPLQAFILKPSTVWLAFVAAVAGFVFSVWLEQWTPEPGSILAASGAGVTAFLLVWAGIWAAAGRLIRHRSHFTAQLTVVSLFTLIYLLCLYTEEYIAFLSNENLVSNAFNYALNGGLLGMLLFACLTFATTMKKKRRVSASLWFAFGITGGVIVLSIVSAQKFVQEPVYPSVLRPYLSSLAPSVDVDGFMSEAADVFESDEFSAKDAAVQNKK